MLTIFFPRVCDNCEVELSKYEKIICADCRHELPLTNFHFTNNNAMKNVFFGRVAVEHATSLLYFEKKGITQHLLHKLKYKGRKEISAFFGSWLGAELKNIEAYKSVDLVIPVPLHKKKLKIRGFNQVEGFAKEIAKSLQKPYLDSVLIKPTTASSQVFKQRVSRFTNNAGYFKAINLELLKNKHVLLVDDIVTTGATLEICAKELLKANNCKLSFATIAIA